MPCTLMRFREHSDLMQSAIREELGKGTSQHRFVFVSCLVTRMAELHKAPGERAAGTISCDADPWTPASSRLPALSIAGGFHARLAPLQAARRHASPLRPLSIDWLPNSPALSLGQRPRDALFVCNASAASHITSDDGTRIRVHRSHLGACEATGDMKRLTCKAKTLRK